MRDARQNLKSLRSWRTRPEKDLSIGNQVKSQLREAGVRHRQSGRAVAAWEAAAPEALRKACVASGSGGVLTLRATSASIRFQLDRWLKGGGTSALRSGGVASVRLA